MLDKVEQHKALVYQAADKYQELIEWLAKDAEDREERYRDMLRRINELSNAIDEIRGLK